MEEGEGGKERGDPALLCRSRRSLVPGPRPFPGQVGPPPRNSLRSPPAQLSPVTPHFHPLPFLISSN